MSKNFKQRKRLLDNSRKTKERKTEKVKLQNHLQNLSKKLFYQTEVKVFCAKNHISRATYGEIRNNLPLINIDGLDTEANLSSCLPTVTAMSNFNSYLNKTFIDKFI